MSKLKILIIEDLGHWQNQLQTLARRLGSVECDLAGNGEIAADYINNRKYDLAIVDLLLASGGSEVNEHAEVDLNLLQAIRNSEANRACAVVVLSGYGNTARTREALRKYAAYDFIEKDKFNAAAFIETLGLALFDARQKLAVERKANRYRFVAVAGR